MAPMSSERMIAARRRTGSGSGLPTASTAHSISLRVFAAAWARAGLSLFAMSDSLSRLAGNRRLTDAAPQGFAVPALADTLVTVHSGDAPHTGAARPAFE